MISNFQQALAVQSRRCKQGKPFVAKSVKRFLKRYEPTEDEFIELGKVIYTPPGFKRAEVFGGSDQS